MHFFISVCASILNCMHSKFDDGLSWIISLPIIACHGLPRKTRVRVPTWYWYWKSMKCKFTLQYLEKILKLVGLGELSPHGRNKKPCLNHRRVYVTSCLRQDWPIVLNHANWCAVANLVSNLYWIHFLQMCGNPAHGLREFHQVLLPFQSNLWFLLSTVYYRPSVINPNYIVKFLLGILHYSAC